MNRLTLSAALAIGLLAAAPSRALFGLGVSYGGNFTKVSGESSTMSSENGTLPSNLQTYVTSVKSVDSTASASVQLERAKVSDLKQMGVKAWVDIPFTDLSVDLGSNLAWGSYKSAMAITTEAGGETKTYDINTGINTDFPVWGLGQGETPYINLVNDLTLRYTFLKLPPALNMLKLSAGAGVTLVYGTRVIGQSDLSELISGISATTLASGDSAAVAKEVAGKLSDNLYTTKWGAHLDLNVQFKLPVIPIAVYADGKWYIHTATTSAATNYPFTISGGLAFAI